MRDRGDLALLRAAVAMSTAAQQRRGVVEIDRAAGIGVSILTAGEPLST